MKTYCPMLRSELRFARAKWGHLPRSALKALKEMILRNNFSLVCGELIYLDGGWYVTHGGLLRLALRNHCSSILTTLVKQLSDPVACRWVFRATVYKSPRSKGFVGYGDANPSNVSSLVRGAEMRVAETRAVNRALRKAYGIGLCSVEELGSLVASPNSKSENPFTRYSPNEQGSGNGQPRLRDRLCQLIRQHQLNPSLVKRYAAEFCATENLRDATREQVESFITHLAEWAARDRDGLLSHLNQFAPQEVQS